MAASGGAWHACHTVMVPTLWPIMGMAGVKTTVEDVVAGLACRDDTAGRTNVDATFDGDRGRAPVTLRCDVAVVHPTAASYVRAPSQRAGAAATAREAR